VRELAEKKPDHLKREIVTIRLPQWMISQLKSKGEIGYSQTLLHQDLGTFIRKKSLNLGIIMERFGNFYDIARKDCRWSVADHILCFFAASKNFCCDFNGMR